MIALVVFDLDGTLVDTPAAITEGLSRALRQRAGATPSPEQVRNTVGLPLGEAVARLLGQPSTDATVTEVVAAYQHIYREEILPRAHHLLFPGVAAGLAALRERGVYLAVVTNKTYAAADALLEGAGIRDSFAIVVGSDDVSAAKPDPEACLSVLARCGVPAEAAVLVGDTVHDLAMARAAGLRSVAVTYGVGARAELAAAEPTWLVDSFHAALARVSTGRGPALPVDAAAVSRVIELPRSDQLRALHTVIRHRDADRRDFRACSGRIMRMLLERALDEVPFEKHCVRTPTGNEYDGRRHATGLCGVAVARAGESLEGELRAMCPAIPIGKILIQRDRATKLPRRHYVALPPDIAERHVLLLDPMLATGGTALAAVAALAEHGVDEHHVVLVTLLAAPEGITAVADAHPGLRVVTSAVEEQLDANAFMTPGIGDFGDRFFGTDTPRPA